MKLKNLMAIAVMGLMLATAFSGCIGKLVDTGTPSMFEAVTADALKDIASSMHPIPDGTVILSADEPFSILAATPIAARYEGGQLIRFPLLIGSEEYEPVKRFLELYGAGNIIKVGNISISTDAIISLIEQHWDKSDAIMLIEQSVEGYEVALNAAPLASYLGIPIIPVGEPDSKIADLAAKLGVKKTLICGEMDIDSKIAPKLGKLLKFTDADNAIELTIAKVKEMFGDVKYIAMANPLDAFSVEIIGEPITYRFEGEIESSSYGSVTSAVPGTETGGAHPVYQNFTIPDDPKYKFCRVKFDLINYRVDNPINLQGTPAQTFWDSIYLYFNKIDADGNEQVRINYIGTNAGEFVYNDDGTIKLDTVHAEQILINDQDKGNEHHQIKLVAYYVDTQPGTYSVNVTIEPISTSIVPLMEDVSALAPYTAVAHDGLPGSVIAKSKFAFGGGSEPITCSCTGTSQNVFNPDITEASQLHTIDVHAQLNNYLGKIASISSTDLQQLVARYKDNPVYIAIMGDTTMIPMYMYKNAQDDYVSGYGLPGDYIYGDIDQDPEDTDGCTDLFSDVQTMENPVGRITGWNAGDASVLLARSLFYSNILDKVTATTPVAPWKNSAYVFIGSEIPIEQGETSMITTMIQVMTAEGQFTTTHTGESLSDREVAGQFQTGSNYIFGLAHGNYYWYCPGAVESLGPVGTGWHRRGAYDVRHVMDMEFGPSVMFMESCITGRIDGILPQNTLSQAYLHGGMNAYIGASRYSWGTLVPEIPGVSEAYGTFLGKLFFEHLIKDNTPTGMAFKDAKNQYVPEALPQPLADETIVYVTLHEFNLCGDPAFNPYEPVNSG